MPHIAKQIGKRSPKIKSRQSADFIKFGSVNLEHKKRYHAHGYGHRRSRSLSYLDRANHR